jgi:hypothetical protein
MRYKKLLIRCIMISMMLFMIPSSTWAKYGRGDRTNSPAYHGRYYKTFHYNPNAYNAPVGNTIDYQRKPSYLPYDYYGRPYGQYYGFGWHDPVFGVRFK